MQQMNNSFEEQNFDSTFDALINYFKHLPKATIKMINPKRYRLMLEVAAQLTDLLKKTLLEGEINIEINQLFNLGSISIELESLTINDPNAFSELICKADNFEIYPLTNGNVKLDITFQSVLRAIA